MSTVTTTESWGSRLGGSFKGIIFGVILLIIAIVGLFWNEGRAVHTKKALEEGQGVVETISIDEVNQENDGKLVHLSGKLETGDVLEDSQFGASVNGIKLKRIVEMYQWDENIDSSTTKKVGGSTETTTTYNYNKKWSDNVIDSGSFHDSGHDNPGVMMYKSTTLSADNVKLGKFTLSESLIDKINTYKDLPITELKEEMAQNEDVKLVGGVIYIGKDMNNPQVGDMKIAFKSVESGGVVSVISQQFGDTFEPFKSKNGRTLEFLSIGKKTSDEMFESAKSGNKTMTWVIRLVGFFLIFVAVKMILKPLEVIGDLIPFVGNIIGFGIGIVSFVIAVEISLIVISIAWIFYRPLFAVALIGICVILGWVIFQKIKKVKE